MTGASGQGTGRSIALTLAREGFAVTVNYLHSRDAAQETVRCIERRGGRAVALQGDVFKPQDCEALVRGTVSAFGRMDVCVIGPGAGWNAEPVAALKADAALRDVFQEVAPVYYLLPHALGEMKRLGQGRIIGIATNQSIPSPSYAYNTAKAARAEALAQAVASAWKLGVTVNTIAPGPVDAFADLDAAAASAADAAAFAARGCVTPQDIAEGVAFLCSDAGRYVTGCVLPYRFS